MDWTDLILIASFFLNCLVWAAGARTIYRKLKRWANPKQAEVKHSKGALEEKFTIVVDGKSRTLTARELIEELLKNT